MSAFHTNTSSNNNKNNGRRNNFAKTLQCPTRVTKPLKATEPVRKPPSLEGVNAEDAQKLKMAYSLYLQQSVLSVLTSDISEFYSRVEASQCVDEMVASELVPGFNFIKEGLSNALSIKMINHLLETDEIVKTYKEFAELNQTQESFTLENLQKALESKYNNLAMKNLKWESSDSTTEDEKIDLSELISKLHNHLSKQAEPTDTKGFLLLFMDALTKMLTAAEQANIARRESEEINEALLDLHSKQISLNLLSQGKANNSN